MRDVTAWERAPEVAARYAPFPSGLHPRVIASLQARGIEQLYTHQAAAVEAILSQQHTIIAASAAGGKSLCFHAPIADALLRDPNARALCLFPTKALTQDQLNNLRLLISDLRLETPSKIAGQKLKASGIVNCYDGDTPQGQRADIRRDARVILSNADMLHIGILPHHTRWASFFKHLRYVVIDEMHMYRGVFGSHVANVIRRLKRLCQFYGSQPIFILASATIGNAREHAERLIEAPVTLIPDSEDGSPHGEQHIVIVNPPVIPEQAAQGLRRSSLLIARDLAARVIKAGAQTICFARSRQDTELLLNYLRLAIDKEGLAIKNWGEELSNPQSLIHNPLNNPLNSSPAIAGYRGGYLPEERRAIEAGLRNGQIRGVVATNALEVGIDIGDLDACVMHGYPGSIASFWQQAGRAGRRRNAALALMVATGNPLDQFLAAHPEYLFCQSPEQARIAPDNLGILAAHVACAAFELPFVRSETLGNAEISDLLDILAEEGDLHASGGSAGLPLFKDEGLLKGEGLRMKDETTASSSFILHPSPFPNTRYTWVGDGYPADRTNLRGAGEQIAILDENDKLIGQTERSSAAARVYVGAVYMHQGERCVVHELNWETGIARVHRANVDYYTRASVVSEVIVLSEFDTAEQTHDPSKPFFKSGEIEVASHVTRYQQIQFNTHHVLATNELDLPEQRLLTTGYWFWLTEALAKQLSKEGVIKLPNDYGPNWQKQRNAARVRDGYQCAMCGKPEASAQNMTQRQHDVHHKIPFRKFGYIVGENDHYLQANQLDNLITVCPECHQRIETADRNPTGLDGLCYVVSQIAPLLVMCDPADLAAIADWNSPHTKLPTITIYELTPGGIGLTEMLCAQHHEVLAMCLQRINECTCDLGCPACVGPPGEPSQNAPRNLKNDTARLIVALQRIYNQE